MQIAPHVMAVAALALVLSACSTAPSKPPSKLPPGAAGKVPSRAAGAEPAARAESPAPVPAATAPATEPAPTLAEIERMPEPEPRVEPIRESGPNKPYVVGGETIVPMVRDLPFRQRGMASWYGRPFHGRRTANGEVFNMYGLSAAHRTLPLPSYARIRNPANGREVVLRINDRGPFARGRVLDLSYAAAVKLGLVHRGHAEVEIEHLSADAIRSGAWRQGRAADAGVAAAPPSPADALAAQAPALPPGVAAVSQPPEGEAASAVPGVPSAAPARVLPATRAAGGFWLQLGAFRDLVGASTFQERVQAQADWLGPQLALLQDGGLLRLQAGPFATRDEAQRHAERVRRELQLVPMLVQRR